MATVKTTWIICPDCHCYLSGSLSEFDYYYTTEEAEQRIKRIKSALKDLDGVLYYNKNVAEFSTDHCELCGSSEAGARYQYIELI